MGHRPGSRRDPVELGRRMASGDQTAAYDAFDEFDTYLNSRLIQDFGAILSAGDRDEAIGRVLARFVRNPRLYRPGNKSLKGFLVLCVTREAKKIAGSRERGRRVWALLDESVQAGGNRGDGAPPWARAVQAEESGLLQALLPRLDP